MNILNKFAMIFSKIITSKDVSPLLGDNVNMNDIIPADLGVVGLIGEWIGGLIYNIIYTIVAFLLSILDIIQLAVYRIMGVGINADSYTVIDPNNPLVKFLTNDSVTRAFRILFVIALVLIVVYTVFAIVISEYKAATSGSDNKKGRIAARSLRSILLLVLFPALLLGGVILTNALFAGFNSVFASRVSYNSTLGTNLFVASSSSASKYRTYANSNNRIPILFDFEDPYQDGSLHGYTPQELLTIYNSFQSTGKQMYQDFAYENFDKFNNTLVYKNNKFYNASTYAGFEKFVVTPEQYQIMADFLDYAMINRVEFYIKNIKDEDIEWKYVDTAIFDKSTTTLKITYKDANDLNGNNNSSDSYTIEFTPTSLDISTPISDAFDTISNILAIGDYEDNLFNVMSRDEDSINVVYWETDKVYLKLSSNYENNPTYIDKLLLYEFNRFEYNNTLDCTIEELENGIFMPLLKLDKRAWRSDLQKYITTEELYVVEINGVYYKVYMPDENHAVKDNFGDFCYEIIDPTPIYGLATCGNHPAHVDGDPYYDYHEDFSICYDPDCTLLHFHITNTCNDHEDHADGIENSDNSYIYDYHSDGTICYDSGCGETHFHKVDSHLTELEKCQDATHYENTCNVASCMDVHYKNNGTATNPKFVVDSSGNLHHYYNAYPICDGTGCEGHNHYHLNGSKYEVCYEACYEEHHHINGDLCVDSSCDELHFHVGDECVSPFCDKAKSGCASNHYHSNGEACAEPELCAESYHRHTIGVCDLKHYHNDNTLCSNFNTCTLSFHRHTNDWLCNDVNCTENHYHVDGVYCANAGCGEDHTHNACDGCSEDHYYFVEPYYEECTLGAASCSKYHYHLSDDGKTYIDCVDDSCAKTHYHYIYPNDDNCVYLGQLSGELKGHYRYIELDTFIDIKAEKLNGSFTNTTTIDGLEIGTTSYYDDTLTKVIKQVNWPQKLMNDMQVIYNNINLNLLLTTGDWLTQLSEIIGSSMSNGWGDNVSISGSGSSQTFDTSLIHPIGLIVSELFLNEVAEDRINFYGDYEFKSSLDEQDLRALLLAICGEDNYRQLSLQVEYFSELFNVYMEPVLEDVAYQENFALVDGELMSEQLYTYKAYLSSILMSATCVEYLFNSALEYIGVSNFSYGLLTNADLIKSIYEHYIVNGKDSSDEGAPNIDIYMSVTISPEDYAEINTNATIEGSYSGYEIDIDGEEGSETEVRGDFNTLLQYKDFASVVDSKQYTYESFLEKFQNIDELFSNYERCSKTLADCNQTHFHLNSDKQYILCSDDSCSLAHYHINSELRNFVQQYFDFSEIYNNDHVNEIIDILLSNIKIIVTPGESSEIVNVVDSTYNKYTELETEYKDYLHTTTKTGVYDKIKAEMDAKKQNYTNPDFEYIISLENYVNGNTTRWNYVQAADYEKGFELVGKLNSLTKKANEYIDSIAGLGNSLLGTIGESFTLNSLEVLYDCLESQEKDPDDPTLDDGNDIIDEIPTRPSVVYNTLKYYAKENCNPDSYNFLEESFSLSLFDYISILLEQANSTSTHSVYGYQNSTEVLYKIAIVVDEYFTKFTINYDFTDDDLFDVAQMKFEDDHPLISKLYEINWTKHFSQLMLDFQELSSMINDYLSTLEKIDILNKYYVTYGVSAYVSTHINTEFDVVVNSKHYTVGSAMSPGKLAEYILGAEKINEMGFQCSFVEDDYKGLVNYEEKDTGGVKYYELSDYLSFLNEFAIGFGETSTMIYTNTNFLNLSGNSVDELVITENDTLMKYVLKFLTQNDYLPDDILLARFNLELMKDYNGEITGVKDVDTGITTSITSSVSSAIKGVCAQKYSNMSGEDLQKLYLNILDYLFINETRENINLSSMTLKDLRTYTINFLIDYESLDSETDEQNQKRYLALFYLSCADWTMDFSKIDDIANEIVNYSSYTPEQKDEVKKQISDILNNTDYLSGKIQIINKNNNTETVDFTELECITGLSSHNSSMAMVLKLAGIDNRPIEELVGLEYTINFDFDGIDEANGDLFVVCTYDDVNHYYVPFMMCNNYNIRFDATSMSSMNTKYYGLNLVNEGTSSNPVYSNWLTKYGYKDAVSYYYTLPSEVNASTLSADGKTCFYPIIARGGFDENGRPTAIRQVGNNIEFYRENVIIQSASELGLEVYYTSVENLYNSRGLFASAVNSITKLITGKTLTQRLVENIPRIALNYSANLPYGVNITRIEDIDNGRIVMNFNFSSDSLKMSTVYEKFDINIVLLILSVIVIFSFIFKALWGVINRLLEIVVLYILGPVAISTIALKYDEKDDKGNFVEKDGAISGVYDQWKNTLIDRIILAFGYIFGLNIFYLLIPMVNGLELFQDNTAFLNIPWGGKLPISLINTIASVFMIIALASAIMYAPKLLSKVMKFTESFGYGASTQKIVKNTIQEAKDNISGQKMMDFVADQKETMKNMIPGVVLIEKGISKIQSMRDKAKVTALKTMATNTGILPSHADAAIKAYEASMKQQRANKAKRKADKDKARAERNKVRQSWDSESANRYSITKDEG